MSRLSEDQRAAILADGTVFDAGDIGLLVGEDPSNRYTRIGDEQIARALRIVARLDGMALEDVGHIIEDAKHHHNQMRILRSETHRKSGERYAALARALEEVGL